MYFPHLFNRSENYNVELDHLPHMRYYSPNEMSPTARPKFVAWYRENYNTPFSLREQLPEYCGNDTEILQAAMLEMRRILMTKITDGYDVLYDATTIAGVASRIYKALFLKKDHISVVPEKGYERNDRSSRISINYFNWLMRQDPQMFIQHAGNGREKLVHRPPLHKPFKLDGYIAAENRAIEFQGCEYHGCPICFAGKMQTMCANHKSAQDNLNASRARIDFIRRQGIQVDEVWECEVRAQLKANREMRRWFEDQPDIGWIDPRTAFSGGRTGPRALFAQAIGGKKIAVMDIISLYPAVNYNTSYPVGVPDIIYPRQHEVRWGRPEDVMTSEGKPIHGLLKVRVLAPQNRRLLVLPVKVDDRLLFCSRSVPGTLRLRAPSSTTSARTHPSNASLSQR